ncbi:short-chain fatty acids transporter [Winogradskyella wandonensis]|uniref:Short-chain fatty acids transporter n=1 Tax=Winogradskyella wandonensis TaxID=1442586 RepID=A0A4R1KJ49_9FLAO|nr:TIGR00366 family protein [Winogradskyella wandonensis]TCK64794.1 short-chain fatty acids transporter [Winogradskyella wandonensis]
MLTKLGQKFTDGFTKYMPSAYVFALLLTLITGILALTLTDAKPITVLEGWYDGFWKLLAFGMQIVLIIITAYCIAQSSPVKQGIDKLALVIKTPTQVYLTVIALGALLSLISFGMVVITAILGRELALRIKGIHYPFLVACVYFSFNGWVCGLSSSIALLLNTDNNFLIESGILDQTISTSYSLGSTLNIAMIVLFVIVSPLLMYLLIPKSAKGKELKDLTDTTETDDTSVKDEALSYKLPFKAVSDALNNAGWLQLSVALLGVTYIVYHFIKNGFDLNFNIMIFIFLIAGMLLHITPMRYSIAMKRASSNISGILFQYPFYAGIMGIMMASGLGALISDALVTIATPKSYAFISYLTGGVINFAIPSAGGEFAVIGPSIINMVQELGANLSQTEITAMTARASMSVAYGESLSNLLQPFFLLIVFPVMGKNIKIQARDVVGYLFIPFVALFVVQSLLVTYLPL